MDRKRRLLIPTVTTIILVFLTGSTLYHNYIQREIYLNNSNHLLATYEQVNRTFTLFTQRNWNVLSDWDGNLQYISDSDDVTNIWQEFADRKNCWKYSDFYMFNADCDYITAANRKGTADSIQNVFQEMYSSRQPVISDYTASSGKHKIVFAIPLSKPFTLDNISYTGVAVSYDVTTVESIISRNVYGDKSSCYLIDSNGNRILSLEPQSNFLKNQENLFTCLQNNATFSENTLMAVQQDVQSITKGCAEFKEGTDSYYLVYQPVGINDWSIVGIVQSDMVDATAQKIKIITIIMISILALCLLLLILRLISTNTRLRLQHQELIQQALKEQKEQIDQLFFGMTQIIDRYAIGDFVNDRYEYYEYINLTPLYPGTESYQKLIDEITRKYIVLSDTENLKMSQLLSVEYLQKVLRRKEGKENNILKIEYCGRTGNIYKIMSIVAVKWDENGIPQKVMLITQDLGKRYELENLANTDGLTGLFNERYFSNILHQKEQQKLPFILYYLDLDHFKPVNDTYGHDMGDNLLKEVAHRLQECIRNNDYAFRIGGDEFALIISADMTEALCEQTKSRIIRSLLRPYEIDGKSLQIGASCGYAVYPLESGDTREIRILADQRMYAEKALNHQKK